VDVILIKYILKKSFLSECTNMAIFIHYSINGQSKSATAQKNMSDAVRSTWQHPVAVLPPNLFDIALGRKTYLSLGPSESSVWSSFVVFFGRSRRLSKMVTNSSLGAARNRSRPVVSWADVPAGLGLGANSVRDKKHVYAGVKNGVMHSGRVLEPGRVKI
jgi:hypothetical protein